MRSRSVPEADQLIEPDPQGWENDKGRDFVGVTCNNQKLHNHHQSTVAMADIDEDAPVTSLRNQPNEDNEPSDEPQDFRFIAALTSKSGTQIPKRGEKDFEPHGTKYQDGVLAASRQAMRDVLDYTRSHVPKNYVRGVYYSGEDGWERDVAARRERRKGLEDDHVVAVETPRGPHFKVAGKTELGAKGARLWLLPEEALYLVERGNLDLWWAPRTTCNGSMKREVVKDGAGDGEAATDFDQEEKDEGAPMSLQAAYAMLLGDDDETGKVSLERYTVYANLKRAGYVVLRAPEWDPTFVSQTAEQSESPSLFTWLFGSFFAKRETDIPPYGPLVKPGMYRSYNSIYRRIAIIPRHKPSAVLKASSSAPEHPFRVVFHLWKPSRISTFAKSNPGEPDFRVAVIDARSTSVPSLIEATSLLDSTPWDPPNKECKGPAKTYQRLRQGYRNVILAVIDQGIISYLRMAETAFGEERMYERFDRGNGQGSKRGGGRGRGRGRGSGRGGRGRP